MRFVLLPLVIFFTAPGCAVGVACTEEARSSVTVHVTDAAGTALQGATVSYTVDGGASTPCDDLGDAFVCAYEVDGAFVIRVEADGYEPRDVEVNVGRTADDCHVESEVLDVALTPVA